MPDSKSSMRVAIVTDFDGTITKEDVGNELCLEACPDLYHKLHAELKAGRMTLKDYQERIWSRFPMNEKTFRARAAFHGEFRAGVNEFLEKAVQLKRPVYIASCGLRPYIEEVLAKNLSPAAAKAVVEIRCNEARFGVDGIVEFKAPLNVANSPWPLDKGFWAQEIKAESGHDKTFIVGIGNGTSDRSLCGKVDLLLATDGLARYCDSIGQAYTRFDDFFEVSAILDRQLPQV